MRFFDLMAKIRERGVRVVEMDPGGDGGEGPEILRVCEDSRKVMPGDLFVGRAGTKENGAKFVEEAVARGAVAVVVEAGDNLEVWEAVPERVACVEVEDVNFACAILAHEVAGNPTSAMTMIGVTGTKGKTTVAYLMRGVLRAAAEGQEKVGMIGTVEIDDGQKVVAAEMTTPGSVELVELFCRMRANGVTHCVMEVSSHALHQKRVAGIDWDVAIFTNLTGDHLDYHKSMEEYAAAKAILFAGLKPRAWAVINGDDAWAERMVAGCGARVVKYVLGENAPEKGWAAEIQEMTDREMRFAVTGSSLQWRKPGFAQRLGAAAGISFSSTTPLVGRHNAYNVLATVAAADCFDIDVKLMLEALMYDTGAPGRLQRVEARGAGGLGGEMPFSVFVDYAHTHDALENVLGALRATMGGDLAQQRRERERAVRCGDDEKTDEQTLPDGRVSDTSARLICVFGCGGDRDRTKRPKMGAVAEKLADVVIVTSDNPRGEEPGAIIGEICAGFSAEWADESGRPEARTTIDQTGRPEARTTIDQTGRPEARTTIDETGRPEARTTRGRIFVEPDRRAAIRMAIRAARAGDVVLIAGKGHEKYQIVGTQKHHFDDVEEAEAALAALAASGG